MASPTVSVVIPCYNAERWVARTIQSVLDQRYPDLDIIVIDDGSTDGSLEIIRSFGARIRWETGPNRGVSTARNQGIAATQSEWLLFLDADDVLTPDTVACRLKAHATDAEVIISDWQEDIDGGQACMQAGRQRSINWSLLTEDQELAAAAYVWAPPAAILYRRNIVDKVGGFRQDLRLIQDARLLFDVAYHGARFAHAPHISAKYRIWPGNNSRRDPFRFWKYVLHNGRQIEALWRDRGTLTAARRRAVLDIYNNAARGLFATAHPGYFAAVAAQRGLGLPLPRHTRSAAPLARAGGLAPARAMLGAIGRA